MSLFKKFFGRKKESSEEKNIVKRGKFMPEIKLPVDEKFTINFKKNGGKFIYCESMEEIHENFSNILKENAWEKTKIYCIDTSLQEKFEKHNVIFSKKNNGSTLFLTCCENLVAEIGGILVSSNQIGEEKLKTLPDNFIVFAATSQLINTIGEGLRRIKNKSSGKIPTNITTIKHFNTDQENDFLSYGSSSKNLYLLLLEDL
ncbi:LUD domain-containing protein [Leptobacterium sp. I13]|uniref:LUD domain-containing protein n=1 Tax=Leptobacterium meishanense TaxID=3128904 RepID=UPI0030ED1D7E